MGKRVFDNVLSAVTHKRNKLGKTREKKMFRFFILIESCLGMYLPGCTGYHCRPGYGQQTFSVGNTGVGMMPNAAANSANQMKTNLQNNLQNVLSQMSPSQKANLQQKTSDLTAMMAEIQRDCFKGGITGISGSGVSGFEPELGLAELRTCVANVKIQVAPQKTLQSADESRSVSTPYTAPLTPSLYSQPMSHQYASQGIGSSHSYQQPMYSSNAYHGNALYGNQYQNRYQYQQPRQNGIFG